MLINCKLPKLLKYFYLAQPLFIYSYCQPLRNIKNEESSSPKTPTNDNYGTAIKAFTFLDKHYFFCPKPQDFFCLCLWWRATALFTKQPLLPFLFRGALDLLVFRIYTERSSVLQTTQSENNRMKCWCWVPLICHLICKSMISAEQCTSVATVMAVKSHNFTWTLNLSLSLYKRHVFSINDTGVWVTISRGEVLLAIPFTQGMWLFILEGWQNS